MPKTMKHFSDALSILFMLLLLLATAERVRADEIQGRDPVFLVLRLATTEAEMAKYSLIGLKAHEKPDTDRIVRSCRYLQSLHTFMRSAFVIEASRTSGPMTETFAELTRLHGETDKLVETCRAASAIGAFAPLMVKKIESLKGNLEVLANFVDR
jgi:hypothetical protein